jgi:hypothetical protein
MKVPDQVMVMDMINWVAGLGAQHATKIVKPRTGVQLMHEVKAICASRYPVTYLTVTWLPAHRVQLRRVYHAAYALTKYTMEGDQ